MFVLIYVYGCIVNSNSLSKPTRIKM